jgi:hypothetical protein
MREEQEMRALAARTRAAGRFWGTVPELPKDVHDLQGLGQVAQTLFGRNDVFGRDDEGDARGAVAGSTSGDAADE